MDRETISADLPNIAEASLNSFTRGAKPNFEVRTSTSTSRVVLEEILRTQIIQKRVQREGGLYHVVFAILTGVSLCGRSAFGIFCNPGRKAVLKIESDTRTLTVQRDLILELTEVFYAHVQLLI